MRFCLLWVCAAAWKACLLSLFPCGNGMQAFFCRVSLWNLLSAPFCLWRMIFIKKVPADAAAQKGRLILLALEYKLDNVCNAERFPPYRKWSCNPKGIRTKINHKDSITLYIASVNASSTIYRNFWEDYFSGSSPIGMFLL